MVHSPCILCDSDKAVKLVELNSFFVNKCESCGLVYVNPRPSKDEIIAHYCSRYKPTPNLKKWSNLKKSKRMLQMIERKIRKGRLLDVGCSYGIFLDMARNNGWDVKGVEIAEGPAEYAGSQNIDIVKRELIDAKFSDSEFEIITMWHLLEHTLNPFLTLLEANRILKNEGFLFLSTPNISSLVAKLCGKYWSWLDPPTHLYYFSSKTIVKLLEKAGFKCLYIKTREGDSGNPLSRILRSISMRFYFPNSTQKEDNFENINSSIDTNIFVLFLKELIKNMAGAGYLLFRPLFWLFWRLHLGTEIIVCAQKVGCKSIE